MSKKRLVLIPSALMDENKKRDESSLIRLPSKTREALGFVHDKSIEVWSVGATADERKSNTAILDIYHAYAEDISKAKAAGHDVKNLAFVTSKIQQMLCRGKYADVWAAKGIHDTIVGADPEFLLFQDSKIIRAVNILPHEGKLGSDGAMVEVRPDPAIGPEELIENIHKIFANDKLTSKIKNYDWRSGCYYKDNERDYPIGGHIHVGNPERVQRLDATRRNFFFKTLNKVLDELLGVMMVRLDGADDGCSRRTKCTMGKYGYFGEWRNHNGRLEYRTLSGMWLTHPTLAGYVVGTAKAITDEVFGRWNDRNYDIKYVYPTEFSNINPYQTGFDGWKEIELCKDLGCTKSSTKMHELLNESKAAAVNKGVVEEWHNKMRGLSTYAGYAKYIDGLREVLSLSSKNVGSLERSLKKNWLEGNPFII
jgi:hypothetical protein